MGAEGPDLSVLVLLAVLLATPWTAAVALLARAHRAGRDQCRPPGEAAGEGAGVAAGDADGPARLLAAAVAALPDDRRDWGRATTAELAQVRGRASRWWFAAGCARWAFLSPYGNPVPPLVVGGSTALAVVAAQVGVGAALPAMRVFALTFVALVGAAATLVATRAPRLRLVAPASGVAIGTAGAAGVAGCVAVTAWFLATHPVPGATDPAVQVLLAVALAACAGLALAPPRALTSSRPALRVGAGTGVALGLGLVLASRFPGDRDSGVSTLVLAAPVVLCAGAMVAGVAGRSFRAGVQATVWALLVGSLLVFPLGLWEALHWYRTDGRLLIDGELGYAVGENLATAIWTFVWLPLWGAPFGVIGAAAGDRLAGRGRGGPGGRPVSRIVPAGVVVTGLCLALGLAGGIVSFTAGDVPVGRADVDASAAGALLMAFAAITGPLSTLLWARRGPGRGHVDGDPEGAESPTAAAADAGDAGQDGTRPAPGPG